MFFVGGVSSAVSLTFLCYLARIFPEWVSAGFYCVLAFAPPPPNLSLGKCIWQLFTDSQTFSFSLLPGIPMRWAWAFMRVFFFLLVLFCFVLVLVFLFFDLNLITSKQNHLGFADDCFLARRTPHANVLSHGK
jgi:hypothetical protein